MVDERDNPDPQEEEKEDLFEIDETGEVAGYISLDQARVLAMQTATREPGAYGRQFRDVPMAFEVVEENEVLYDMTYNTMIDAYTEPLSGEEIDRIVGRLDMQALAALVAVDPAGATALLRSAREGL